MLYVATQEVATSTFVLSTRGVRYPSILVKGNGRTECNIVSNMVGLFIGLGVVPSSILEFLPYFRSVSNGTL